MDKSDVRVEVQAFQRRTATDRNVEDCFPAWYLSYEYGLSDTLTLMQTSDPAVEGKTKGYDFGLDGFYLDVDDPKQPRLILVQAKYSDNPNAVSAGFKDLERCLPKVANALDGAGSDEPLENKILFNLRRILKEQDRQIVRGFNIDLIVIHLCDQDEMIIRANARKNRDELAEVFRDIFPDRNGSIEEIGPRRMSKLNVQITSSTQDWTSLTLTAVLLETTVNERPVKMYSGIGHLSELVELYNQRRDELFSKNVRYFLKSKRNVEKGPSAKIKDTLKQICTKTQDGVLEPEVFAFYHNGVTVFARAVDSSQDGVITRILEPYILNGCQTIKTSYYFRYDTRLRSKIDDERWRRIKIPIRIITTRDDELIRLITISNNRQNQISAAALRANDEMQIELANRFKRVGIFYQRQEGAFEEIVESNPSIIDNIYTNTNYRYVDIEDLARCLSAVASEFELAKSSSHIFEYDAAYKRCFSPRRLASITFLTFLQNLHDVIPLILKKDLELYQMYDNGPNPARLAYYTMYLFVRYLAYQERHDFVQEFGGTLWGHQRAFRDEVSRLLNNYNSKIKGVLQDKFMALKDTKTESLKSALMRSESWLGLKDVDPFDVFRMLDNK